MSFKKNVGTMDRVVRFILALVFVTLILTGVVSGALAVILGILAAVFVVTGTFSFCPLYLPFKLSTSQS